MLNPIRTTQVRVAADLRYGARAMFATLLMTFFWGGVVAQPGLPELPALMRNVSLIENGQSMYPHLPPLRTSADGRIGLNMKAKRLYLLRPESLSAPFLEGPDGVTILANNNGIPLSGSALHGHTTDFSLRHAAICERTPNPRVCGNDDCYDLTIVTPVVLTAPDPDQLEFWSTDLTLRVSQPKTAQASLAIDSIDPPLQGPIHPARTMFETMITGDGQLLVARVGGSHAQFPGVDIVYSVGNPDDAPCDISQWTQISPITSAHTDPLMIDRYGIAAYPFRDPVGTLIPAGADLRGSYPWIDRGGDNLFFTTIPATLWYQDASSGAIVTRYPAACVPGTSCQPAGAMTLNDAKSHDETSRLRGVSMAGLWTHGKIVTLDGIINNTDYGMKIPSVKQRMVALYEPGSGPLGTETGEVRVGTGRHNGPFTDFPPGFVNNSTFIDSIEQIFNANTEMFPLTPRDVVWNVATGHATDEVAFDDWVNPNAFIFSQMNAAMSWAGGVIGNNFDVFDGFERVAGLGGWIGRGFTGAQPVRVQNSATPPDAVWAVPAYGRTYGAARIEPVALGGIRGKGVWLTGSSGIAYDVPSNQPRSPDTFPWYAGIFIDSRFADDSIRRDLIRFPDGSRLQLTGRHAIHLVDPFGVDQHVRALAANQILPESGWAHLGLLIQAGGQQVRIYLNGDPLSTWTASGNETLFRVTPGGTLHVGQVENSAAPGFRGWVDEFKLFAENPGPEVICNHARGTLIETMTTVEPEKLNRISPIVIDPEPVPVRSCFHDYGREQPGAHLRNLPSGTVSLREQLLFPEGPLHYDQPRPDSSGNGFCLSCHTSTQATPSLRVDALLPAPGVLMQHDPRRQPMQPAALIFGHIPANLYAPGVPPFAIIAPPWGAEQDQWVFP